MEKTIYPRSPREVMSGWTYLPRFVDKIRLHLAGKLPADYQPNFCKGFDEVWLDAAGLKAEDFIEVVRQTITDGEVADWINRHVKKSEADKTAHREYLLKRGSEGADVIARLEQRKQANGLGHRTDIKTFIDMIEVDEKRIH